MAWTNDARPDPVARRYDHLLAMGAYALLVASVFFFWLPALGAAAIAYMHRREADPLSASHFRFQLKIFWVGVLIFALAVVAAVAASGAVLGSLLAFALGGFSDWTWPEAVGSGAAVSAGAAASLLILAVVLWGLASAWTVCASLWGGLKLVRNRPMGQSRADPSANQVSPL